ncbi:hypothetical protein [Nocardia sp. NPDC048505]
MIVFLMVFSVTGGGSSAAMGVKTEVCETVIFHPVCRAASAGEATGIHH